MNTEPKKSGEPIASIDLPNSAEEPEETVVLPDVPMPDIYSGPDPYEPTVPNLKIIDVDSADADDPAGFDPYDTAVLVTK